MIKFIKKLNSMVVVAVLVLFFGLFGVAFAPCVQTGTSNLLDEYNIFDHALSEMLNEYNDFKTETVSLLSVEQEETSKINRLIVNTSQDIDDYGAVAKAEFKDYHIFQYKTADDAENAYQNLSQIENVEVGFDYVVSLNDFESEIEVEATYNYNSWGADYIGYKTYVESMLAQYSQNNLNNVVVAVLDSGINTSHVLFKDRILHEYGKNYTTEKSSTGYAYEDYNGHGTHVSGTIAEATLSNVKILPLKVLNSQGKGLVSMIVSAINYAITLADSALPGLKVMNMSIGVDDSSSDDGYSAGAKSTSLNNAVINAYNNGILSVVSAGNENRNTSYAVPANVDCAITVSAVKESYDFTTGKNLVFHGQWFDGGYSNYGEHVDFCAPGTYIKSTYIGSSTSTAILSGTSMAAPHVTAAVALVYSNPFYKDLNFDDLNTLLRQNADKSDLYTRGIYPVSSFERDDYYGYGLICVKGIGLVSSGYVTFSETNEFQSSEVSLSLEYDVDINPAKGEYIKIYYTTQEDVVALDMNSNNTLLYSDSNPIKISKTTKITAAAFVFDSHNALIKKSYSSSQIYYFDNYDLMSNFSFEEVSGGLALTKYSGKLTTLKLQEKFNSKKIVAIDETAFNGANVETLYLPENDGFKINNKAFYSNSIIKKIIAKNSLQIGNEAFRYCKNLEDLEIDKVTKIGDFALANNSKIKDLFLPNVIDIGQHAFSGTNISTILVGQNLASLKDQSSLSLLKIYGYAGTVAESFAYNNNIEFCDLSLRIVDELNKKKIIKQSDNLELNLGFVGYLPTYSIVSDIVSKTAVLTNNGEHDYSLKISLNNLELGEHTLKVDIEDAFGNKISSSNCQINVLNNTVETCVLNFDNGNYNVYLDGDLISSSTTLFKGYSYEISILPDNGYVLKKVYFNDEEINSTTTINVVGDITLVAETDERETLNVNFVKDVGGKVLVDGQESEISTIAVARTSTLSFSVEPEDGYRVVSVVVNGQMVYPISGYTYSIENVVEDLDVEVKFALMDCKVKLMYGRGGSVFERHTSALAQETAEKTEYVSYGSNLVYDIVCSDGYAVDFVTVNGEKINVKDNTIVLENITEDCEIIVSFKTVVASLFDSEHSTILNYFIIFAALFVVFVVARILLLVFRRR